MARISILGVIVGMAGAMFGGMPAGRQPQFNEKVDGTKTCLECGTVHAQHNKSFCSAECHRVYTEREKAERKAACRVKK